jgi:hypothetical protein
VGNVSVFTETEPFEIVEADTFEGVDDDLITQILGDLKEDLLNSDSQMRTEASGPIPLL